MKSRTHHSALSALALVATVFAAGVAHGQTARQFSFAYDQPTTTAYGIAANIFDAKLKELSGGTMSINQFPGGQLGQEPQALQKMRAGDIDFVITSTANASTLAPQAGVFSLHFIFRDQAHLAKVLADPAVAAEFRAMIKDSVQGAQVLGLLTMGMRNMYSKKEVKSIADVKNEKVRVQATKTEDAFFSAYKAVPIHMPFGQVYTSLQTGLIQIAENGNDVVLKNKHYEAAPVVSKTEHEANNSHLWVSQKTWDSLTPEQRTWVTQAADYSLPIASRKALELNTAAVNSLQKLGVKYVEEVDKKSFSVIATPLQDSQAQELGKHAVQILALVRGIK